VYFRDNQVNMNDDELHLEQILNVTTDAIRKQSRARQDPSIDLWTNIERSSIDEDVHMISMDELFTRFHTDRCIGLSMQSINDAREHYGNNRLTPPKQPSYFWLLFKELFMGFNCILWFACLLAFLTYEPFGGPNPSATNLALGVVLFIVIVCNSILNVYQQIKSIKIVASFSKLIPTLATVRRHAREQQILTDDLVPGDIILIRMGDKLPADCRFIICDGLKVMISRRFLIDHYQNIDIIVD
jgi:sodium/potassium-transporting ATPase subunit alpha